MKTIKILAATSLSALILVFSCKTSKTQMKEKSVEPTETATSGNISENNNLFALELYKNIGMKQANLFYSPYSISTALAMTFTGAHGKTESQMRTVMHFETNGATFYEKYHKLINEINAINDGKTINIYTANSIWAQKDFKLLSSFTDVLKNSYNTTAYNVDFVKQPEPSRLEINKWVEQQTNEKIKDLIQPGLIDYLTRLVLVNAIYFKANWEVAFDEKETRQMTFRPDETSEVSCDFMFAEKDFKFYEQEDGLKAIEIPYSQGKMSMLIILPGNNNGFDLLKKNMDMSFYNTINKSLSTTKVKLYLPKFKFTSDFELSDILVQMGMTDAFFDRADFSGMTGKKDLKISKVIHKAFVEVNESGTEAAAATAVVMRIKSMPVKQPEFRADHPFMFIIKENTNNGILFAGDVYDPTK
ncbi:MAG: serpin family protein [Bacteroidales bacterium]|jgi:serpin B|nr:serpin family protein [Bacteroidales bacterium]MDD4215254.1 serpin family protein [Bacteroidales bacterium]